MKAPNLNKDFNPIKMNRNSLNPNIELNNFAKKEILKEI